jgi:hypothetical protein
MSCNNQESVHALQKSLESGEDFSTIALPEGTVVDYFKDDVQRLLDTMQLENKELDVKKEGMGFSQDFHEWAVQTPKGTRYIVIGMFESICCTYWELCLSMSEYSNRDD